MPVTLVSVSARNFDAHSATLNARSTHVQRTLHARSTHVFSDEEKEKIAPCGKCCVQLLLHGTVAAEKKRTAESSNHRENESPPHKKNHPAETWNVEEVVGFFAQLGYESAEAAARLRRRTRRPRGAGPPTEEDH